MTNLPRNPYVAGNPVGDSAAFVGRDDVLREVLRVLRHDRQNAIVLYGQRRIGKTSILQHLVARLPEEGPYHPVYFDLQDKAALPLEEVLRDLARTIAHELDLPEPDLGPEPVAGFRGDWLPTLLDSLPEDHAIVLLLDEFDVLADPKAEQAASAFFPYLRGLLASDPGRLQFEFVIGRNIDDLDHIALSVFKGTPARRISLLNRTEITHLVRLSEANGTLHWPDEAVERVWQWTHGHPFLTQQLCSYVWERAYDEASWHEASLRDEPRKAPSVTPAAVDEVVSEALDASRNTMEWLWDGLPPAERVVASALAEAGTSAITPEGLERLLHESGVRVVIRELQSAPRLLQDWDLIEPTPDGYRFRVELLRRWIAENKPLHRVQEEMDYIEPVAENLYQAALGLYRVGKLDQATASLRQATTINPNHLRANQLLADILLSQGQLDEAQQLLELLYKYQPAAARPRLVQVLLAGAPALGSNDEQLDLYEQVLELDPKQPEALAGKRRILRERGDTALAADNLRKALAHYRQGGLDDRAAAVEQEMRRRDLTLRLQEVEGLEQALRYQEAYDLVRELAAEYSEMHDWPPELERIERERRRHELANWLKQLETLEEQEQYHRARDLAQRLAEEHADLTDWTPYLERLETQARLKDLYQRALGALQSGDQETAQALLVQVVTLEPGYRDATRYLHLAVTGAEPGASQFLLGAEGFARIQAEIEKEKEARRQRKLAALYAEAVRLFKADRAQEALDKWAEVQALDPGYRDRKDVEHRARRKLETPPELATMRRRRTWVAVGVLMVIGVSLCAVLVWWLGSESFQLLEAWMVPNYWAESVAFSPGGKTLASASTDGTVVLWDLDTGERLRTLDHSSSVHSVAFSPDRTTLASEESGVVLWDVETGERLRTLKGHTSVASVAFSPDGTKLASGSWDSTVMLWDVETGKLLHTLTRHTEDVQSVAFSPYGTTLASGSEDNTVILWDVETGEPLHTLRGHAADVQSVAFSPEGTKLASGSEDDSVILWDVETGERQLTLEGHTSDVQGVAFNPDGTTLVSGSWDDTVILWDVETGERLRTIEHRGDVESVAFSPDGTRLALGSDDNTVILWDLGTGEQLRELRH